MGSRRLDRFLGRRWAAVGDAAMAWDPMSAHGLTNAIHGGADLAGALLPALDGDTEPLVAWAMRLERAWDRYARERAALRAEAGW